MEEVVAEEETEEVEGGKTVEEEMKEVVVVEEVVEGEMEGVVGEEMEEVVVVTPLGSFLSSKTAADTAARLAPELGNSVSCARRREGGAPLVLRVLLGEPVSRSGESGNRLDGSRQRFPLSQVRKGHGHMPLRVAWLGTIPKHSLFVRCQPAKKSAGDYKKIPIKSFTPHHHPPPPVRYHRPLGSFHHPSGHLSTLTNSDNRLTIFRAG
jgi:hypothetical protein